MTSPLSPLPGAQPRSASAHARKSRRKRRASSAAGYVALAGAAVCLGKALGSQSSAFLPAPGSAASPSKATAYNAEVMAKRLPADSLRYKRWSDMAPRGGQDEDWLEQLKRSLGFKQNKILRPKINDEVAEQLEDAGTQTTVLLAVGTVSSLLIAAIVFATPALSPNTDVSGPAVKNRQDQIWEQWYSRAAEASKKATRLAQKARTSIDEKVKEVRDAPTTGPTVVAPSIVERIRGVSQILDTCQQDIYDEVWAGLGTYPKVLDGYILLFESFTDTAYPVANSEPAIEQLRGSLKFEVGRFTRGVNNFDDAVQKRNIREIERAFADMSLAYDRFLKAGNLYEGYDPITSTTIFYDNIDDSQLVYTPISLEQPRIRDEVLVIQGPDKGKVGRVIWLGRDLKDEDKVVSATVKLDPNPMLGGKTGKGFSEVKSYPYPWIAVTRTSQQDYLLDVVLASAAALFSCALTYPLDTLKARIQSGLPLLPPEGIPGLLNGLTFNLLKEVPNQGFYMAGFNLLTRQFCQLPFIDANNPNLKLLVMVPAGILGFGFPGSFIRAPFEVLNRQIQTGEAATNEEAWENVFGNQPPEKVIQTIQKAWILCIVRGIPFGALQCTFYEAFKDRLELIQYGVPLSAQPFIWGALAGALTGIITNPPDLVLTKASQLKKNREEDSGLSQLAAAATGDGDAARALVQDAKDGVKDLKAAIVSGAPMSPEEEDDVILQLKRVSEKIYREDGWQGFFKGGGARALYFAPEACLWFSAYEFLRTLANTVIEI